MASRVVEGHADVDRASAGFLDSVGHEEQFERMIRGAMIATARMHVVEQRASHVQAVEKNIRRMMASQESPITTGNLNILDQLVALRTANVIR